MKTNINIFNNLNESLERELNNKRKSREIVKSRKEKKLTESSKLNEEEYSFEEIITRMENATDYEELYSAASLIKNDDLRTDVEQAIDQCESDGDDVETAYSIVTSDILDMYANDLNESKKFNSNNKLNEYFVPDDLLRITNGEDIITIPMASMDYSMGDYFYNGNETGSQIVFVWNEDKGQNFVDSIGFNVYVGDETSDDVINIDKYLINKTPDEELLITLSSNDYMTLLKWKDETERSDFHYYSDEEIKNLSECDNINSLKEDNSNISDLANEIIDFYDSDMGTHFDEVLGHEEEIYNETLAMLENKEDNKEVIKRIIDEIRDSETNEELANKLEAYLNESSINESEDEYEAAKYKGKEWGIFAKKSNSWVVFGTEKEMKERAKELNKKAKEGLKEEDIIKINQVDTEPDYLIQDVTVLDQVGDGDVQSPDIEALLTLVDNELKENYSEDWGHIKTLSSKIDENTSYALVDISTPEILKELDSRGIKDAAIGKNLILEKVNNKLVEFKVNNLNGTTKYSKRTSNPQKTIYEWIESEFLQEAKEEKAKEAEIARVKTEKETVENYINNRLDLRMEIENIKMFIELSKEVKAEEEMKPTIQNRMYAFAAEVPHQIEVNNNDNKYELSFSTLDEVVTIVFGKEWVKEPTPDNEVVGVIKESEDKFKDMVTELHGYIEANPQTISSELKKAIKDKTVDDYLSVRAGMSFDEIFDFMNRYSLFESQKMNEGYYVLKRTFGDQVCYDVIDTAQGITVNKTPFDSREEANNWIKSKSKKKSINEAYEQFNIGEIEVVFNPDTYETLYSIPSADVQDKKINLTKVPTVDTPYDTDTIIKSYIETRFGRIPSEEEKEMIDNGEVSEPQPETSEIPPEEETPQDDINIDEPDLTEDELPDEPEENEVPNEAEPEEETPEAETGSAVFMKVRPKQEVSIETLRNKQLEGDTPTSNYIVVDTIDLMDAEFEELSNDLSQSKSWLEGLQAIDRKNYSFNVIKATNANSMYDILIDPLGYNYPRYVAIIDK